MKKLIIDNYDSFTYNLYHILDTADIIRNDELSLNEIAEKKYTHIIISPGPGSPDKNEYFGVCPQVITYLGKTTHILGICLGLQGIWNGFGGKLNQAETKMHGKTSTIKHSGSGIFENIPQGIKVMRYHSLVADETTQPDCIEIIARTIFDSEIMAIKHKEYPIYGVQFHPESFGTDYGKEIIENFLKL